MESAIWEKMRLSNDAWKKSQTARKVAAEHEDQAGQFLIDALALFQKEAILLGKNLVSLHPLVKDGLIIGLEAVFAEGGLEKREYYYDKSNHIEEKNSLYMLASRPNSGKNEETC